jgi:FkbM family methyltransferase
MIDQLVGLINNFCAEEPKVILDIGSRDLDQSIELSGVYPSARVIALEPNPAQFDICKQKCMMEDSFHPELGKVSHKNIEVYNYAASDVEGEIDFWVVEGNPGGSSILEPIDVPYSTGNWNKISVEAIRLDFLLAELQVSRVDVVWMDVQGAELLALKGMGNYLDEVLAMHTEASPSPYYKGHLLKEEVESYLHSRGFDTQFYPAPNHPYNEGDLLCLNRNKI